MRIITITYSKLFSLGNFQNEKIELTAELDSTDTLEEAMNTLQDHVNSLHIGNVEREREAAEKKKKAQVDDDLPF